MDYSDISPRYIMQLIPIIEDALKDIHGSSYGMNSDIRYYIESWQKEEKFTHYSQQKNFNVYFLKPAGTGIDVHQTLLKMPRNILIQIAIDLGIDTPGFLPVVPQFKNNLRFHNPGAHANFVEATKSVHEKPDQAVALASSTLEGVISTILDHKAIGGSSYASRQKTLAKQASALVKEFGFDDKSKCPPELITIAGQLRGLAKTIEDLRSDKTSAHGKSRSAYIIDDPLWASFVVNTSATLGMFLWEYFDKKYLPAKATKSFTSVHDSSPF